MSVLTFRKDGVVGLGHEHLGEGIECQQSEGVEVGEGVAEVYQSGNKDKDVEDEGSHIAEHHCEGQEEVIICEAVLAGW
jgi:hypothetical protein